jgi:hypothetical protein
LIIFLVFLVVEVFSVQGRPCFFLLSRSDNFMFPSLETTRL